VHSTLEIHRKGKTDIGLVPY